MATISGRSAHAGQSFLTEYGCAVRDQVKQVFLVHGEDGPAETLQEQMKRKEIEKVSYPFLGQAVEI